jgi:ABC-2 type transport system ATP-binding protein
MDEALRLEDVTKSFGATKVVDGVSFGIAPGSICGLIGPNGAGKTTTIRMVMSIIYPDQGSISVLGQPNGESVKDRVGYLPEERGLYKKMKTGAMLAFFARLKGVPRGEARRRALGMLEQHGLGESAHKRCEALSKGMAQKVQILSALIHDPALVILDEPFSGLDPLNLETMRELILQARRDGRTVVFSTHVMEQAEQLCDSIVMIDKGKTVLRGGLSEVKAAAGQGIHLDYDGEGEVLRGLPGVRRVNDAGKHAEILLEPGADPQAVLAALVGTVTVRRFDLREPSLHEIFVRTAGGQDDG